MRRRSSCEAGFSLAEVMVALFILALVSAAGSGLLFGATNTNRQITERDAFTRQVDLAQAMIRGDIADLSERGTRPDDGFSRPGNLFGEAVSREGELLRFVRSGWINPGDVAGRSQLQHVAYTLEAGALVRTVTTRPDETRSTPQSRRVLLGEIEQIVPRFMRGGIWSEEWIGDAGQSLDTLPDVIELDIQFENDTRLTITALAGRLS